MKSFSLIEIGRFGLDGPSAREADAGGVREATCGAWLGWVAGGVFCILLTSAATSAKSGVLLFCGGVCGLGGAGFSTGLGASTFFFGGSGASATLSGLGTGFGVGSGSGIGVGFGASTRSEEHTSELQSLMRN